MNWLLSVHVLVTLMMLGLIWFVQVVHYPLFKRVPAAVFTEYEKQHTALTFWVVAPLMLAELGTGIALIWMHGTLWSWMGGVLIGINWLSTYFIQVPLHRRLSEGYDHASIIRLVNTNWIRTVAWTLRGGLLLSVSWIA